MSSVVEESTPRFLRFVSTHVNKVLNGPRKPRDVIDELIKWVQSAKLISPSSQSINAGHSLIDITADLDQLIVWMYCDVAEKDLVADPLKSSQAVQDLCENDLIAQLFFHIKLLSFEGRKSLTRIVEYSLLQCSEISIPYIDNDDRIPFFTSLVAAYDTNEPSIAFCADSIFRACITHDCICETIFNVKPSLVMPFLRYVDVPNFDISSHAYDTLKTLLTQHPDHAANFLRENYDEFFTSFNQLLQSEQYLTKVHAFALLSELLMQPANNDTMIKYINDPENLKCAMVTLRSPQRALQLAAFNVLKVFVPNPFKADSITRILVQNKRNFLNWLNGFERDSTDEVLKMHRQEMINALQALPDSLSPTLQSSPAPNS